MQGSGKLSFYVTEERDAFVLFVFEQTVLKITVWLTNARFIKAVSDFSNMPLFHPA
jgi:hypothetical protein